MDKIKVNLRLTKENHGYIVEKWMWENMCKSKSMALEEILNNAIEEIRKNDKIIKEQPWKEDFF